jgi:hypothetical protein
MKSAAGDKRERWDLGVSKPHPELPGDRTDALFQDALADNRALLHGGGAVGVLLKTPRRLQSCSPPLRRHGCRVLASQPAFTVALSG